MANSDTSENSEYRVLARKYRPGTFDELIGQEAMVKTLGNAIQSGRLAHAFILTGVRGVGKTTTARLIARALNCTGADGNGPITADPCGVCDSCVGIAESRHVDVLEMDAASRTGVDDVREIIESVRYAPASARYKVYIIDEVHMLSKNAFNALLKTLEEPPPHVKFVYATTEIRKLPVTVLSRCQRFDLRRVESGRLIEHLSMITEKEGVTVESDALALIARAAEGSVRDALSLLDQAIAHSAGDVKAETMRGMLGLADRARILDLFEALMAGKADASLAMMKEQYDLGADPAIVLKDLMEVAHWLTRLKVVPEAGSDTLVSEAERTKGGEMAGKLSMPHLTRAWQLLLKGVGEVQRAPVPLAAAEMVLIRLAYAADLPSPAELVADIRSDRPAKAPEVPATAKSATGPAPVAEPIAEAVAPAPVMAEAPPSQEDPGPTPFPSSGPTAEQSSGNTVLALNVEPAENDDSDGTAQTVPAPATFEALVEMFEERKEGLLGIRLRDDIGLVTYKPGVLEFVPSANIPIDLPSRVRACLEEWTGQNWQITISREGGAPSLREQAAAKENALRETAMADPLVQKALEVFPGAEIGKITTRIED